MKLSLFKKQLHQNRKKYRKDIRWHVVEGYTPKDARLFIIDGSTFAITNDDVLVSLCRNRDSQITGLTLVNIAIKCGAKRTYAFGEKLKKFYEKCGFYCVGYVPFDKKKAPKGWTQEENLYFFTICKKPKTKFIFSDFECAYRRMMEVK